MILGLVLVAQVVQDVLMVLAIYHVLVDYHVCLVSCLACLMKVQEIESDHEVQVSVQDVVVLDQYQLALDCKAQHKDPFLVQVHSMNENVLGQLVVQVELAYLDQNIDC